MTCPSCFETFQVLLEIDPNFRGTDIEIYDCTICCNPNEIEYDVYEGGVNIITVNNANE
ncbi:MAG: hypothetical protein CMM52_00660 [Rhodospirillaceae bacterium]|nr:hypothetical protein [Rhodospirillaceae bacterium]